MQSVKSVEEFLELKVKPSTVATALTASTKGKIGTPDGANDFIIYHETLGTTVNINDKNVTVSSRPILEQFDILEVTNFKSDNEIYGIPSANVTVYAVGAAKS